MAFRIENRGVMSRQAFRPMLGAVPSLTTLANVAPDSVPPQKVEQIPVTTDEANKARLTYKVSVTALGGLADDLDGLEKKTADYDRIVSATGNRAKLEYDTLVRDVRGRTSNSDAEYELELQWWSLWKMAHQAWENRPSSVEQLWAYFVRFLGDFVAGAQEAWQQYSEWALRHSGPLLRKYHDALEHMAELELDLQEAQVSGKFSDGALFEQQQSIERANEAMNTVRGVYRVVSAGGNIDEIALSKFGPLELGAAGAPAVIGAIVGAIAGPIIWATAVVLSVAILASYVFGGIKEAGKNLVQMYKDNPVGTTLSIGFILGMIALPFALFKAKEVIVQPSVEKPA